MFAKLYTLQGSNPDLDPRKMSTTEAAFHFLKLVSEQIPGITWGQLAALMEGRETMAGWWTDLKRAAGDVKDGTGDVLKEAGNYLGDTTGKAVRLATDEQVVSGVSRGAAAYYTGGTSEAAFSMFGNSGSGSDLLTTIGEYWQRFLGKSPQGPATQAGITSSPLFWPGVIGASLVALLFFRPARSS